MLYPIEDKFWHFLLKPQILRRAAHIVAKDSRFDFQDASIEQQVFSQRRDESIQEIIDALSGQRYMPSSAIPVLIPKSEYSQRPGAILPFRDRILTQAIVMCLAPILDEYLSENVWSWRVRAELRGKTPDQISHRGVFDETDITAFPFLKRRTVSTYLDEFEPWYALWPRFDVATMDTLKDPKFKFMVFSDIAGYFENIQISLLQSILHRHEPNSPNTINLLIDHLLAWAPQSHDGSRIARGIPQGNSVSSFLGNFFLKPVDDHFELRFSDENVKYFRYMDDIRIITTNLSDAHAAALNLESQIRRSQLNLQSAKTEILPVDEAIRKISDRRLSKIDTIRDRIDANEERSKCIAALRRVAVDTGDSKDAKAIATSFPPLSDLNLRTLRRWAGLHLRLKSPIATPRLVDEILNNAHYKVTRDAQRIALAFPQEMDAPVRMWTFVLSGEAKFPYQQAELIRALRLFDYIPEEAFDFLLELGSDDRADPYLRLQALLTAARAHRSIWKPHSVVDSCLQSSDLRVVTAGVVGISLQERGQAALDLLRASRHASHEVNRLVQYVRAIQTEEIARTRLLAFIFRSGRRGRISVFFEFAPFLRFVAHGSTNAAEQLRNFIDSYVLTGPTAPGAIKFLNSLRALTDREPANPVGGD